ncbi:MAG: hypothetical protein FJY82_14710 [Candidatus Aminicenantes bacterium]|nr:hypothetical protein [Candidatus Aminicenantes bacterium]
MDSGILALTATAASIGFIHTLIGPDHYLPFIAMSQARGWTARKTLIVTFLCGLGHVLSSVLLGLLGIGLGIAVSKVEGVESFRGNIAGWMLLAFGLAYFLWGLRRAVRNRPHSHLHEHPTGEHAHVHTHAGGHLHVHDAEKKKANITPWVLFTIFIFGPCEPLIPILMYPAAKHSLPGTVLVASVFAAATIGTMLAVVALAGAGMKLLPLWRLERYSHAAAGAVIFLCGFAIQVIGL